MRTSSLHKRQASASSRFARNVEPVAENISRKVRMRLMPNETGNKLKTCTFYEENTCHYDYCMRVSHFQYKPMRLISTNGPVWIRTPEHGQTNENTENHLSDQQLMLFGWRRTSSPVSSHLILPLFVSVSRSSCSRSSCRTVSLPP